MSGCSYLSRDYALKAIGYSSYAEYLASDRWKRIRARVKRRPCFYCSGEPHALHHTRYEKRVLLGQSLKGLRWVCNGCHGFIEFDENNRKRSQSDARYVTLAMDSIVEQSGPQKNWPALEPKILWWAGRIRAMVADGRSFKFAVAAVRRERYVMKSAPGQRGEVYVPPRSP